MLNKDIIVALATPRGNGAIALIRISGSSCRKIVSKAGRLVSGKSINEVLSHTINFGCIYGQDGKLLDKVLFLIMDAPRSFTGEDTIEITCHNNNYVIDSIINLLCFIGARPALPGEFSRRAVLNDKIDLLKAEAINDLIKAQNEVSVRASLLQIEGSLSKEISDIDLELCKVSAWCMASFEFLEEDRDFSKDILFMLNSIKSNIEKILSTNPLKKIIKEGIRVVILGAPNSGKSSLFNFLASKNKAIVSNEPGTTRDIIEHTVYGKNINITFVDTAGIRDSDSSIEKQGIEKAFFEAGSSDLIIILCDAKSVLDKSIDIILYKALIDKYKNNFIFSINKTDLIDDYKNILNFEIINYAQKNTKDEIAFISVKNEFGLDDFLKKIYDKIGYLESCCSLPYFLNDRQIKLVGYILDKLQFVINMFLKKDIMYELIIEEIQDMQIAISDITGKDASENAMNKVFKDFCIGK